MRLRLDAIVAQLGGELYGDGTLEIRQVATLQSAGPGELAFLANPRYRRQLDSTAAAAVILAPELAASWSASGAAAGAMPRTCIAHANPYIYYARAAALLNPPALRPCGVLAGAVVASSIPDSVSVGENAVVGRGVQLGERVVLYPGVVLGDGVCVGDDSILYPNVVIYAGCVVGARAIIHAGAVIGADGFGFAREGARYVKIPQIGRVVIGDDVEIGANTTIDRGALDDTVIGNGVKLDNQIQIAHNCVIGENTAMAGCVGIAGSTRIGARCTVAGAGMIVGHLELADDVHVSAGSMVTKDLRRPGQYTSIYPLEAHQDWLHNAAQIKRLSKLADRVAALEKQVQLQEPEANNKTD